MTTLAIRGTTNTDHQSIDDIGMPGFQFIQDPLEYGTQLAPHAAWTSTSGCSRKT